MESDLHQKWGLSAYLFFTCTSENVAFHFKRWSQVHSGCLEVCSLTVKVTLTGTYFVFGLQILHNYFYKHDKCPGISDASMLSVPETVKLNPEDDIKDFGMH